MSINKNKFFKCFGKLSTILSKKERSLWSNKSASYFSSILNLFEGSSKHLPYLKILGLFILVDISISLLNNPSLVLSNIKTLSWHSDLLVKFPKYPGSSHGDGKTFLYVPPTISCRSTGNSSPHVKSSHKGGVSSSRVSPRHVPVAPPLNILRYLLTIFLPN